MKISKLALWIGLVIFGVLIIWATPVTFRVPTIDNIIITLIFIIIEMVVLYFLFKGDGKERQQVAINETH